MFRSKLHFSAHDSCKLTFHLLRALRIAAIAQKPRQFGHRWLAAVGLHASDLNKQIVNPSPPLTPAVEPGGRCALQCPPPSQTAGHAF